MTLTEMRSQIANGIFDGWAGGVAIVWSDGQFDVVPHAYLNDVSWSGRNTSLHCQTLDSFDAIYVLNLNDSEFIIVLDMWLAHAIDRNR